VGHGEEKMNITGFFVGFENFLEKYWNLVDQD
jgi:hypothetical protein